MKILLLCSIIIITSCTTASELALNTAAGVLGNMIDRRVEDKLGNDAGLSDEKLDGKISRKNVILCKLTFIENEERYYECEDREDDKR
tara:strand:- start:5840 stop:6103 length:264 start_codon:yes stop_codon:yes gene_type:complete